MPKRNNKEKMAFDDWFVMNYARLKESIGLMSVFLTPYQPTKMGYRCNYIQLENMTMRSMRSMN